MKRDDKDDMETGKSRGIRFLDGPPPGWLELPDRISPGSRSGIPGIGCSAVGLFGFGLGCRRHVKAASLLAGIFPAAGPLGGF